MCALKLKKNVLETMCALKLKKNVLDTMCALKLKTNVLDTNMPMTGFELWTSSVGSNQSAS